MVSANFTSKYTLKTCILSFKFGQFHLSSFSLEVFCVLVSVRPDNFSTQILQKINKSDYKCDISVSISLRFASNTFRKVRENIFEPNNVQNMVCFDHIIEKAQMTPGSESATYEIAVQIKTRIVSALTWPGF